MNPPKIVIVGHVCIDQNTTEHASYTGWGSSVLYIDNVLRNSYGVAPVIITEYGPDLLEHVSDKHFVPAQPTQAQTLQYQNDTRVIPRIWRCFNLQYAGEPPLTATTVAALQEADIVIVATLLPNYTPAYIAKVMSHAKPDALRVLCPQGYLRNITTDGLVEPRNFIEATEIIPLFNIVVYSEDDIPNALEDAARWSRLLPGSILVTQGENGASIVTQEVVTHVPTSPIAPEEIIDSVGCGDVFDAAFAYTYHQTQDLVQSVQAANAAAGEKLRATFDPRA